MDLAELEEETEKLFEKYKCRVLTRTTIRMSSCEFADINNGKDKYLKSQEFEAINKLYKAVEEFRELYRPFLKEYEIIQTAAEIIKGVGLETDLANMCASLENFLRYHFIKTQ